MAIAQAASLPPYESDLVCDFFRQLGGLETARRYENEVRQPVKRLLAAITDAKATHVQKGEALEALEKLLAEEELTYPAPGAKLVGNAQNPLDHLVGDVLGQTERGRYFIIEFKREASGFLDEVDLNGGKPDRVALLCHLEQHPQCSELSPIGHFGAHWTPNGLKLSSYISLITSETSSPTSVPDFFHIATFNPRFGWTADQLMEYIKCMTAHGVPIEDDDGKIVFGYFTQEAVFVPMVGSAKIFSMIQEAFKRNDRYRNRKHGNDTKESQSGPEGMRLKY